MFSCLFTLNFFHTAIEVSIRESSDRETSFNFLPAVTPVSLSRLSGVAVGVAVCCCDPSALTCAASRDNPLSILRLLQVANVAFSINLNQSGHSLTLAIRKAFHWIASFLWTIVFKTQEIEFDQLFEITEGQQFFSRPNTVRHSEPHKPPHFPLMAALIGLKERLAFPLKWAIKIKQMDTGAVHFHHVYVTKRAGRLPHEWHTLHTRCGFD